MSKIQYILALLFLFVIFNESFGGIIPRSDIGSVNPLLNKRGDGGNVDDMRKRQESTTPGVSTTNPPDTPSVTQPMPGEMLEKEKLNASPPKPNSNRK
ncbi:hypothetical protein C2G38_1481453 [Gigaspora rosea]|uniref:Secreted protein n=1 Tax=Gigaspora rosea TaxID=44941 RepID=A0A397V458_9GLOM|nr:hypothetical protein C2G38_1481453 [Gigaspora rosea]